MESRTTSSRGVASTCRGSNSNSLNQVPAGTVRRPHLHAHRKVRCGGLVQTFVTVTHVAF